MITWVRNFPLRERLALYNRALALRSRGLGYKRIAKKLGISAGTVRAWVKGKKPRPAWNLKSIDLRPTQWLGYLVGEIFGDGWLYRNRRNWRICLGTKSPDQAILFEDACRKVGLHPFRYLRITKRLLRDKLYETPMIVVVSDSKNLWELLHRYKGSRFWQYPTQLDNPEFARGFLQGIFDAEGSVSRRSGRKRGGRIHLWQKDKLEIETIVRLLARFGIPSRKYISRTRGLWFLQIYQNDGIKKFHREIGFRIPHKRKKLEEVVRSLSSA